MLSLEKRIFRFKEYFLKYPELRKLCFESQMQTAFSDQKKINLNFSELFLSSKSFDWFRYTLNEDGNYNISTIPDVEYRRFAQLGKELGLNGQLSILWKHGNFQYITDSRSAVRKAWSKVAELQKIIEACDDYFDGECESCRIIDSYYEGLNNYHRNPVQQQQSEKYLFIYLLGKDRYFEKNNLIASLK
jgi:hypothetical protein